MIKFFRKIRQRMLKENKIGKYLLYAIGEIILVVIGILIALQVNNWNQERHHKASEATYLTQLLEDSRADSIFFQSRLTLIQRQSKSYSHLIQLCEGNLNDSLLASIPTGYDEPFLLTALGSATLKSIAQDGEKISDPSVKQSVRNYEQRYEYVTRMIDLLNSDITQYGRNLRITMATLTKGLGNDIPMTEYKLLCEEDDFIGIMALLREDLIDAENLVQLFLTANETLSKEIKENLASNQ